MIVVLSLCWPIGVNWHLNAKQQASERDRIQIRVVGRIDAPSITAYKCKKPRPPNLKRHSPSLVVLDYSTTSRGPEAHITPGE